MKKPVTTLLIEAAPQQKAWDISGDFFDRNVCAPPLTHIHNQKNK